MKVAIMQPYFLPYIGYFQLINSVDVFVFYDDVNFIKGGWINRNNLLVNKGKYLYTIPLTDASANNLISETKINSNKFKRSIVKFLKTIEQSYKNAPYYNETMTLLNTIFDKEALTISELAIKSVKQVSYYLGINTNFETSSMKYPETKGMEKSKRLIAICTKLGAESYVNLKGGIELYDKSYFNSKGVDIAFLEANISPYKQFSNEFVPALSIIDILMFNNKVEVREMLDKYNLN